MTVSVLHTASETGSAWWLKTSNGAAKIDTTATTTAALLTDRAALEAAIQAAAGSADTVAVDRLTLISPVTRPCRVVAQMTNFESHVRDAGMASKVIKAARIFAVQAPRGMRGRARK